MKHYILLDVYYFIIIIIIIIIIMQFIEFQHARKRKFQRRPA